LSTVLADDELIVEVRLPSWPPSRRWAFEEFSRRRGDFAIVGIAAFYDVDPNGNAQNTRIVAIGAADRPRRLRQAEAALDRYAVTADVIQRAARAARLEVDPPDDLHASAEYRRNLVEALVERALHAAVERSA
jgi:carbon-monoxide dehydrogenase medium subunit